MRQSKAVFYESEIEIFCQNLALRCVLNFDGSR